MDALKLPFRADYAKSGRAGCKGCKQPIAKDSLRLANLVQSRFFDGIQPNWFHQDCFFKRFRPRDVSQIAYFESLRWNDQEKIKQKISQLISDPTGAGSSKGSKSRKRNNAEANGVLDLADYTVEYAKSKKSKCKVCEEYIDKGEMRISKKDYESESARQYGPVERWHHVDCFIKAREELNFFSCASIIPGFKALSPDDQNVLKSKIPAIQGTDVTCGPSPVKKPKEDGSIKKKQKKQNDMIFKFKDSLKALSKPEIASILKHNNQDSENASMNLDLLVDVMTFGALKRCEKCQGQLIFQSGIGYKCTGNISEWVKCTSVYAKPERVPFQVPKELKDKYEFLKKYKGTVGERLFTQLPPKEVQDPKSEKSKPVLHALKFFIHKTDEKSSNDVKNQIDALGGSVVKKWEEGVFAVVSTRAEVEKPKLAKAIKSAKDLGTVVLADTFFDDITPTTSREDIIRMMEEKKISSWDSDLNKKLQAVATINSVYKSQSTKSIFKSGETSKKLIVKGGVAVDPDSLLDKIAHVYKKGDNVYNVVLGLTDVQTGKNCYYKLQVLRSDTGKKFWLFRSWGRIGTTIGGNKVEQYNSLEDCIHSFEKLFEEKSGNLWENRGNFKKLPGKMMMLDVQYDNEKAGGESPKPMLKSKTLPQPVQDLISLIFDIDAMETTMKEFELDLNKMPLGKLSQQQIQKAFSVLSELQNLLNSAGPKHFIIEKTNMFYTLVPHDCGVDVPPVLDNEEIIKQKIDMLNSLVDIEIAYKLLKECQDSDYTIDQHYNVLNADITVLSKDSKEYKMIELYLKNTHAKTHQNYSLTIEHVFKIERKEEAKRFKKFSKFPNRKLLWHGSRVTNFAGILSQGLRIAPPEAPVTGYMFGKGIYFADMVSKSANYCNTSLNNPTGLLLLCEVALGNMHELKHAENIVKPPSGKDSVKGIGSTEPNPKEKVITPTGAEVIIGRGVESNVGSTSLLYNEYIVYDVAQVKIQYLLRVKFHYKI